MAPINERHPPEFKQVPLINLDCLHIQRVPYHEYLEASRGQNSDIVSKAGIIHPLCHFFMGLVEAISAEHCADPRRLNPILPVQLQHQNLKAQWL